MGPEALAQVLQPLRGMFPAERYPDLLVGLAGADDAAVYRVGEDCAVIQTVDFFPPVVDDPYDLRGRGRGQRHERRLRHGRRGAAGAEPLRLPRGPAAGDRCRTILRGGAEKVAEAGGVLAGGPHGDRPGAEVRPGRDRAWCTPPGSGPRPGRGPATGWSSPSPWARA